MDGAPLLAMLLVVQAFPFGPKEDPKLRPPERPIMGYASPSEARRKEPPAAQGRDNKAAPDGMLDTVAQPMRNDARLSDVCFVDAQHGWAVGDRGTIWHTNDGGRRWDLQDSGVTCPLESVCFLDQNTGWAVGGWTHPYTHTSSGVVLITRDGGRHWQHNPRLLLPALKRAGFFDERRGWAIGCASAMYPGGLFTTDSGGQNWLPCGVDESPGWLTADFLNLRSGAIAGRNATAVALQQGRTQPARLPDLGLRSLRQVRLVAPRYGWLAGEGGLLLITGDLGASWQSPPGALPEEAAEQFDFAALAVRGPKVWVAGSPGTRVFCTQDAGRTWHAFPTGSRLPIHALHFVDDEHGWAVGALGTVLATDDGGRTWRRQRSAATRAAILGLFSQVEDVPLELFARLSGNEGYLGIVEVLNPCDLAGSPHAEMPPADRLHEAVVAVGGSGASLAWRFPVRQPQLQLPAQQIIDGWDRANNGRGIEELEAHVVRKIRLWRPDVIVTHDASPRGDDPLRHLINQVVSQAVRAAGDPNCYSKQITRAGLEPWQVRKVYAALPPPAQGSTDVTTAQVATRLGRSLADVAALPRGLLEDRYTVAPPTLGFRLLVNNLPQEQGQRDFTSGIVLQPGGEARREPLDPPAESLDLLRRIAEKRRNMQAILEKSDKTPQGGTQLLGQAGELILGLDSLSAGQILYQLGDRYYRSGRWDLAADTFTMLTTRYPDHPLSRPALIWLVQYYASAEAAWRGQALPAAAQYPVQQATSAAAEAARQSDRPARAMALAKQIEQTRPDLFAAAVIRFPLAAAYRAQVDKGIAHPTNLLVSQTRDAWWACAQGEAWLAERKGPPPKPVLACVPAASKPHLDGRLDDELWKQAKAAQLQSACYDDDNWPAAVMLAYDAEFLYVAIKCRQAPGAKYETAGGPRPRDADLAAHDRVDIFLDLDRDFATYYHFSIDHRGWTAEDCWGDKTWSPKWFLAAKTEDGCWTAEAAIPLDQLAGRRPKPRDAWAMGIQRTIPGVGFQSWSSPAAPTVLPEGFGYLIFE